MRPLLYTLLFLLFVPVHTLNAQDTFIKRYKNSNLPEGSSSVAELPGKRYVLAGVQSGGFAYTYPMLIITDVVGKQLIHFVDSNCTQCNVNDVATDSYGFIYTAGSFYGKAGVAKYDTLGNRIWLHLVTTNGQGSTFSCIANVLDSMIVVGGVQYYGASVISQALMYSCSLNGDSLWILDTNLGNNTQSTQIDILGVNYNNRNIYASGVIYDTLPQRIIFLKLSYNGQLTVSKQLEGRKWGYWILPIDSNLILIGGRADNSAGWGQYCFVTEIDSVGNELYTIADSNYLFNEAFNFYHDSENKTLYIANLDSINENGFRTFHDRISAYQLPLVSLQSPIWEKTITGTEFAGHRKRLNAAEDRLLLFSSADNTTNCSSCPFLLKADEHACTDIACDTGFVSGITIEDEIKATFSLYPNPVTQNFVYYNLQSDANIYQLSIHCYNINGQILEVTNEIQKTNIGQYTGKMHLGSNPANSVYIIQVTINNKHKVYGRFIKLD